MNRNRDNRIVRWALPLLALLIFTAACDNTPIGQMASNPGRFQGKSVTVAGEVTNSFGLLGQGAYEVNDGTGSVWVVSGGFGIPGKGIRVQVSGTFESGVTFSGKTLGNAIEQTRRYKTLQ